MSPSWPGAGLLAVGLTATTAFILSAAVAALLASGRLQRLHVLDHPNERSLHSQPVPRTGGLALLAGLLAALLVGLLIVPTDTGFQAAAPLVWLALALFAVAAVSYLDDRRGVARRLRLAVHLLAALLLWLGGLRWEVLELPGLMVPLPLLLALPLTLLYSTWMLNLYNFMDGMDGLAGGMASIGFATLAVLGYNAGGLAYAACCAAVAAAAAGFLSQNLPPARLFLGDVGSSSLGLLAAGLSLWGASAGLFPLWIGWLIFSPFIVDASWTLLRRAANRERLWDAHRSHHYQRLVLVGWGHRRTLGWALLLIAAVSATALAAPALSIAEQWQLIAGWAAIFVIIHLRVGLAERQARL